MNAHLPSYLLTYKSLEYASEITKSMDVGTLALSTVSDVAQSLRKLGTFQLLHQFEDWGVEAWHAFRKKSIVEVMGDNVRDGRVKDGILVWRRHHHEGLEKVVLDMLWGMPDHVPPYVYLTWVKYEVGPLVALRDGYGTMRLIVVLNC